MKESSGWTGRKRDRVNDKIQTWFSQKKRDPPLFDSFYQPQSLMEQSSFRFSKSKASALGKPV